MALFSSSFCALRLVLSLRGVLVKTSGKGLEPCKDREKHCVLRKAKMPVTTERGDLGLGQNTG